MVLTYSTVESLSTVSSDLAQMRCSTVAASVTLSALALVMYTPCRVISPGWARLQVRSGVCRAVVSTRALVSSVTIHTVITEINTGNCIQITLHKTLLMTKMNRTPFNN